ncbi:MAG TPA: site-2 protease family protein [Pirellulales bacterium]|nr:site-2 protease family protein [Pirellulales bacterium]
MFSVEPPHTQYDLHFAVAGVPVRVHPLFWLISLLLGVGAWNEPNPPKEILLWVAAVFVSIVVHELGHALAFRFYRQRARIVLYSFGGLAIADSQEPFGGYGDYASSYREERGPGAKIMISFAGPLAGFLFAALVLLAIWLSGHQKPVVFGGPMLLAIPFEPYESENLNVVLRNLLFVNVFWGLVNLLPIFPLDGGQISRELLTHYHPRDGLRQSLLLSIFAAIVVALWALVKLEDKLMAIFFAYLAYVSYQVLQQISGGDGGGRDW